MRKGWAPRSAVTPAGERVVAVVPAGGGVVYWCCRVVLKVPAARLFVDGEVPSPQSTVTV